MEPGRVDGITGVITTVAGNGEQGFSGDGGPANSASLDWPVCVAVDGSGNLYIADSDNNKIRRLDASTGVISTVSGKGGDGFSSDGSGNLYIVDSGNHNIRRVDRDTGAVTAVAGNGSEGFSGDGGPATSASLNNPSGVATDGWGNVVIADFVNHRIRRVDGASGIITTVAGNGERGFSGDGGPATSASLYRPSGVGIDGSGNIYVADLFNHKVRHVDAASGVITTVAGNGIWGFSGDGGPAISASLNSPWSVAVDPSGNLYIADMGNHRIRRVDGTSGVITTVAGNGAEGFSDDGGPANSASLDIPQGVAVDGTGDLYIADAANNRVRRVEGVSELARILHREALNAALRAAPRLSGGAAQALNEGRLDEAVRLTREAIDQYSRAQGLAPEEMRTELGRAVDRLKAQQRQAEHALDVRRYNAAMDSANGLTREADALFEEGQRSLGDGDFEVSEAAFRLAEEQFKAAVTALRDAVQLAEAAEIGDLSGIHTAASDLEEAFLACGVERLRGLVLRAEAHLESDELGKAIGLFLEAEEELTGTETGGVGEGQVSEIEYLVSRSREGVASCRLREATVSLEEGNRHYEGREYVEALDRYNYNRAREILADLSSNAIRHGLSDKRSEINRLDRLVDSNIRRATQAPIRLEVGQVPEQPFSLPVRPRRRLQATAPTREGRRLRSLVREIDSYFKDGV